MMFYSCLQRELSPIKKSWMLVLDCLCCFEENDDDIFLSQVDSPSQLFLLVPCSLLLTIVILQCESWYVSHFFKKDATCFFQKKRDYFIFANYITVTDPLRGFIKPTTGSMPRDEPSLLYYIIITSNQRSTLFSHTTIYSILCEVKCV